MNICKHWREIDGELTGMLYEFCGLKQAKCICGSDVNKCEVPNTLLCASCGGICCKQIPPCYTPKEIITIFGTYDKALRSGKIAIDWWESERPLYFMRPKAINDIALFSPSWGGQCIHLDKEGCVLPLEQRPYFCKKLEPKSNKKCTMNLKKYSDKYIGAWLWKRTGFNFEGYKTY